MTLNKKAVVIMPNLHDYPNKVKDALEREGYETKIYHAAPPTFYHVIIRRIARFIGIKRAFYLVNRKLMNRIKSENSEVDCFIVIRGETLDYTMLKTCMKHILKDVGKSTYYSWDSFKNLYCGGELGKLFQKRFTFDSEDSKNNKGWLLLPLFYSEEYDLEKDNQKEIKYDLCCVTGLSLEKYDLYKKIKAANPDLRIKCKMYLDKKLLRTKMLMDSSFREMDPDVLITSSMSAQDIISLYRKSKAILDLPSSSQSGLSMRTIESLGLRQKIVTTNSYIKEYDFYSDNNVWVLGSDCKIESEWFDKPYLLDDSIRSRYSITSWCKKLIQEE